MALLTAQTKYGAVRGVEEKGCTVFRGIPFAKPPVGELRFMPPVEPEAWDGIKVCDTFAPACIQGMRPGGPKKNISEDCLYLNVWTPAEAAGEKLPVMFWIYGGGFQSGDGASPDMNGANLTKHGVIVVTINYRCGPLGFFSLPEWGDRSGNFGLLDQAMALRWVYENISAFGGDPERILVFGQSAGGVSTRCMLVSPLTRHMVRRAIPESGGGLNEADPVHTKEEFQSLCSDTLSELGWTEKDIMERDPVEVLNALNESGRKVLERTESGRIVGVFQPYIDGYVLPDVPGVMILNGDYNTDAEVICVTVSGDDWMFSRKVQDVIPESLGGTRPFGLIPGFAWARRQVKTGGRPIRVLYFNRLREEYKESRMYRPGFAPHGSEIAYVFGNLDTRYRENSEFDLEVSDKLSRYWTNFAKTGDPNSPDGEGLEQFPLFTAESPKAMLVDDSGFAMADLLTDDSIVRLMDYTEEHPGMLMSLEDF